MFNTKLGLFVSGRKTVFKTLTDKISTNDKVVWFHTASLGEYEQGLPVLEALKKKYPNHKFVLTFFSPSGFEVKKDSAVADVITYLPLDTKANARKFIKLVHPELVVFVKYEFWPNYLAELKKQQIHTISISTIFRPSQAFFKWYGGWMRKSLHAFHHIFVQDEASQKLLKSIDYTAVTISGDTRFDRVLEILDRDNSLPFIEDFKNDKSCIVMGSSWQDDETIFVPFINAATKDCKFIIAPHNIKSQGIEKLRNIITKSTVLFSEMEHHQDLSQFDVFIIDTIGILTKVYSYATIAYVGGGMGNTGLHNTLEPAVFGIPVVIGKNYSGFKEAEDLVQLGGVLSVTSEAEFNKTMTRLLEDTDFKVATGTINHNYVQANGNVSKIIMEYLSKH
ncbi:glycosyltransferase N-terminal domain-containing protein [Kordia algicida OT-1]|uniref:3-deoxy-D-manno-octulosonic acid transferase n=1 Tax=Kordia algicida OT-1 TaxID=391587 RepID=A9DJN9_9FLAO|nr:glycosyltransferase N-terminal domain-containing protein [Kordia algicida]EDP98147.1 3-deoxy-D-manno-octulosonic-acid transferase, putative [Kordia algicida OT-1]